MHVPLAQSPFCKAEERLGDDVGVAQAERGKLCLATVVSGSFYLLALARQSTSLSLDLRLERASRRSSLARWIRLGASAFSSSAARFGQDT